MNAVSSSVLVRNPRFAALWVSQLFNQGGIRMYQIAMLWWLLSEFPDQSARSASVFLMLGALPSLLFVRWIGGFLDRYSIGMMITTASGVACCLIASVLLILLANSLSLSIIYPAAFLLATAAAVVDPALGKALPRLVSPEDLPNAVAFQASTQSIANFGGAVCGALLLSWLGINGAIAFNFCSYLVAATGSWWAFRGLSSPVSASTNSQIPDHGLLAFFRRYPATPLLLFAFGLVNFFGTPTLLVLPLYTKITLSGGPELLAILEACLWLGLVGGAFLAPRLRSFLTVPNAFIVCLALFGVFLAIPGFFASRSVYGLCLFGAGMSLGVNNAMFLVCVQRAIPDYIKGRFFATLQMAVSFTFPIAFLVFGALCDSLSPMQASLVQGGGVAIVSSLFLVFKLKRFRLSLMEGSSIHE